jgi:hypothetical protein
MTREIRWTETEKCRYGLGNFELRCVRSFEFDGWYIYRRTVVNGITWNAMSFPARAEEAKNLVPSDILAEFLANHLEVNPIYGTTA